MKLAEKILYCRKRAGLSQEALASQIGVSRQAISKWETAEAVPEVGKLTALAKAFQVSTDWLLSEDEPASEADKGTGDTHSASAATGSGTDWVEAIPGAAGRLLKRYGWLFGVYLALSGSGLTLMGILMRTIIQRMTRPVFTDLSGLPGGSAVWEAELGNAAHLALKNNPVYTMAAFFLILGILLIAGGTILAVYLKKRTKTGQTS